MKEFCLSMEQLSRTADLLARRVGEGLERDEQEIRCLPAWVHRPEELPRAEIPVLDAGGTNLRAARVSLGAGEPALLAGPVAGRLPTGREEDVTADDFFGVQAEALDGMIRTGEPVGYCFSYPAQVLQDRDALLLKWTKEVRVPGVVGQRVGRLLARALEKRGIEVGAVTVLNDTVAALMAMAASPGAGEADAMIGLIVGTGTNMASFFEEADIRKLGLSGSRAMAVNLESGNFSPDCLTEFDEAVDRGSDNPGEQRFEKAVSGVYLARVHAAVMPDGGLDPATGALGLSRLLEDRGASDRARELARLLLDRSADLVAAGLAGLGRLLLPSGGRLAVAAEGGTYWNAPGYHRRVIASLQELLGDETRIHAGTTPNANLIGSAAAAAG